MKIIVDAMGGDHAPLEIVKGALRAKNELGTPFTPFEFFYEWKKVENEDKTGKGLDTLPCSLPIFCHIGLVNRHSHK